MKLATTIFFCGMFVSLAECSNASQFIPLGFLDTASQNSSAFGVDATGHTVVGQSYLSSGQPAAFIWQQSTGIQFLEASNGGAAANGITPNGQTIVGRTHTLLDESFATNTTQGFSPIHNTAANYPGGNAASVSDDGKVVVGMTPTTTKFQEAYRWTQQGGVQSLGDLPGRTDNSWANAISGDGSTIVGTAGWPMQAEAFRWTQANGMVGLGDLSGGDVYSAANDVSASGAIVVGGSSSGNSIASGREAFRWDQTLGMVGLGFLPTKAATSEALSVTPDGSVIVGLSGENGNAAAFVWDAAHGMRSLQNLISADPNLVGNLTGWKLQLASAISADGKAIVGTGYNPQGKVEAFLVLLDAPLGVPEPNCFVLCGVFCAVSLGGARQRRAIR